MVAARPRPAHKAPTAAQRARSRVASQMRAVPRPLAAVSAALLTGTAVAGGAVLGEPTPAPQVSGSLASEPVDSATRGSGRVGRSSDRPSLTELKAAALTGDASGSGRDEGPAEVSREAPATPDSDPRDIARAMLVQYGWSSSEFSCLDQLWTGESDWKWNADNPTSSAYGIPQSLPGEKMASAGPDWETNPATQIEWGLAYIRDVYGTPCSANDFKNANNWY